MEGDKIVRQFLGAFHLNPCPRWLVALYMVSAGLLTAVFGVSGYFDAAHAVGCPPTTMDGLKIAVHRQPLHEAAEVALYALGVTAALLLISFRAFAASTFAASVAALGVFAWALLLWVNFSLDADCGSVPPAEGTGLIGLIWSVSFAISMLAELFVLTVLGVLRLCGWRGTPTG